MIIKNNKGNIIELPIDNDIGIPILEAGIIIFSIASRLYTLDLSRLVILGSNVFTIQEWS